MHYDKSIGHLNPFSRHLKNIMQIPLVIPSKNQSISIDLKPQKIITTQFCLNILFSLFFYLSTGKPKAAGFPEGVWSNIQDRDIAHW